MCWGGGRSNLDVVLFGEISKKARRVDLITEAAPKNAAVSVRVEGLLIFTMMFSSALLDFFCVTECLEQKEHQYFRAEE